MTAHLGNYLGLPSLLLVLDLHLDHRRCRQVVAPGKKERGKMVGGVWVGGLLGLGRRTYLTRWLDGTRLRLT